MTLTVRVKNDRRFPIFRTPLKHVAFFTYNETQSHLKSEGFHIEEDYHNFKFTARKGRKIITVTVETPSGAIVPTIAI